MNTSHPPPHTAWSSPTSRTRRHAFPPGFSSPVSTALGWVKALGLVVAIVALIRIGVHVLRQQGDGVPDRDDTFDKLINWVVGIFIVAGALAFMSALGLSIAESC